MSRIDKQHHSPRMQRLRRLLQTVEVPQKSDTEWLLLENELFFRLDTQRRPRPVGRPSFSSFVFRPFGVPVLRPVALGAAIIAAVVFSITRLYTPAPTPYAGSQIIDVSGDITVSTAAAETRIEGPSLLLTPIHKGQIFTTGDDGVFIVQLDSATAVKLNRNSRLTVVEADRRHLAFHLDRGSLLATVGKRSKNQHFIVTTPHARCRVVGTVFSIALRQNGVGDLLTDLMVYEGRVEMTHLKKNKLRGEAGTGQQLTLHNETLGTPAECAENQSAIRDISLLKLKLEIAGDSRKRCGVVEYSSAPPGAEIIMNSQVIGTTPMIVKTPVGTHEVCMRSPGYERWTGTCEVTYNTHTMVSAVLKDTKTKPRTQVRITSDQAFKNGLQDTEARVEGYVNRPEYIEALIQMTVGEYRKALTLLDSLMYQPDISLHERRYIIKKIARCYAGLGNFERPLKNLQRKYRTEHDHIIMGHLLWEIATIKANCLEDYRGAITDLKSYIHNHADGSWIEQAYQKLAELYYLEGNTQKAAEVYRTHIERSSSRATAEGSVYYLAELLSRELKNYGEAVRWYEMLLGDYPQSAYRENTLFELAECYTLLGRYRKARQFYQKYLNRYPEGRWATVCSNRLTTHY